MFKVHAEGRWVTMKGQAVYIGGDGTIEKGPANLLGMSKGDGNPSPPRDLLGKDKKEALAYVSSMRRNKGGSGMSMESLLQREFNLTTKGAEKYVKEFNRTLDNQSWYNKK